jgi:hypothetical protein
MTDYYFSASSYDVLAGMLAIAQGDVLQAVYPNVIGPLPGRVDAGDPALWYVAIRSDDIVVPPAEVNICDPVTGQAVLGVWA